MTYSVKVLEFNRGNTVYREGEKSEGIYLIYKGDFNIWKRLELKPSNTYQRFGNYAKKLVKKDDVPLVLLPQGLYFGINEAMK